jgi:hypothetical protein
MKKSLIPLAFIGLTLSVSTLALADSPSNDSSTIKYKFSNKSEKKVLVITHYENHKTDTQEFWPGQQAWIKICAKKPYQVEICWPDSNHDDVSTDGNVKHCQPNTSVYCHFSNPTKVSALKTCWGACKPVIKCERGLSPQTN